MLSVSEDQPNFLRVRPLLTARVCVWGLGGEGDEDEEGGGGYVAPLWVVIRGDALKSSELDV